MTKNIFEDLYNSFGDFRNLENVFNTLYKEAGKAAENKVNYTLNEDKHSYTVEMDLPGVKKEDLDIAVREEKLFITAKRKKMLKQENGEEKEEVIASYEESFTINMKNTDVDNIKASLTDGVLTVTLPKKEEVKFEKKIDIK